ncbi:hypothetical protein AAG570_000603 [Ranatra chinensis]|uniref:Small ribosomal subunit protein bS16m n=1 Tax=Ranatra chinensis TaxID=642074 RepID=A0ABD0YXI7_9HEMI
MASVLLSSSGSGRYITKAAKAIRLARHGCTNRPFFHIVVMMKGRNQHEQPIEQLGSFDPMPNNYGEQLVSFNFERIQYWIGQGCEISTPAAELLGLCGFLPVHPHSYMTAWRNRRLKQQEKNPSVEPKDQ